MKRIITLLMVCMMTLPTLAEEIVQASEKGHWSYKTDDLTIEINRRKDGFCGYRFRNKHTTGIVIRNGEVLGQKTCNSKKPGLAQKMQELGCTEALNLDGGGTAAMMFMGEVLNRSDKKMRSVSTLIGFGKSEQITE